MELYIPTINALHFIKLFTCEKILLHAKNIVLLFYLLSALFMLAKKLLV